MGTPMNFGRRGRRFEKRYDYEVPTTKKQVAQNPQQPAPPTAEQINRQIATDNALAFKSDADVVLVNLTMTTPISRQNLRKNLNAKGVHFDDAYVQKLLVFLSGKRRVIATAKGDMWKRT